VVLVVLFDHGALETFRPYGSTRIGAYGVDFLRAERIPHHRKIAGGWLAAEVLHAKGIPHPAGFTDGIRGVSELLPDGATVDAPGS